MWWRQLAEVQTKHQTGEERGFKWLWTWNCCWCQTGWSEYFKNCWSTEIFTHNHLKGLQRMVQKEKISSEWQLCGRKCLVDVRGQRKMGRLVRDDRKATVTQITTCYNRVTTEQNTISEFTTHRTLKQMGYSSRRPHWVPLLSTKNRKRRLQFTQAHQNWTKYSTWVLLLNMSIPLWQQCTHLLMATSSRIMHHVTKLKSSQTGFLNMTMSSLYSNGLRSHQISIQ